MYQLSILPLEHFEHLPFIYKLISLNIPHVKKTTSALHIFYSLPIQIHHTKIAGLPLTNCTCHFVSYE